MTRRLKLGISTCPNDTFLFHGLLSGEVEVEGLAFDIELLDVEALNEALFQGAFDVAKASFHAALALSTTTVVLRTGSALGHGVGPVVLAPPPGVERVRGPRERPRVLTPGRWTTASLLWRLFHPEPVELEERVFSDILPALARGEAERGVCIHEGRFTYAEHGLRLVEDLGERWAHETPLPLPLGGILARRTLGPDLAAAVDEALARSLAYARAHPERALESMRRHAQEHDERVLWKHVELYVTEWTRALGPTGTAALDLLSERAIAAGLVTDGARLEVRP